MAASTSCDAPPPTATARLSWACIGPRRTGLCHPYLDPYESCSMRLMRLFLVLGRRRLQLGRSPTGAHELRVQAKDRAGAQAFGRLRHDFEALVVDRRLARQPSAESGRERSRPLPRNVGLLTMRWPLEQLVSTLARVLRGVHGHIGVTQDADPVSGRIAEGDIDAQARPLLPTSDLEWLADRGQ